VLLHYLARNPENSALVHCVDNTLNRPICAALSTSFILSHAPNSRELNALITRFRRSHNSANMSRESKKIEEIRQLVEFRQCTNTAFEWKMQFLCFPVLPGSAAAHVIWSDTIKRLLIAYFISKISAKKYQNPFTCGKVETRCTVIILSTWKVVHWA